MRKDPPTGILVTVNSEAAAVVTFRLLLVLREAPLKYIVGFPLIRFVGS